MTTATLEPTIRGSASISVAVTYGDASDRSRDVLVRDVRTVAIGGEARFLAFF